MRVLFCGDRNWTDVDIIQEKLQALPKDTVIIAGGAKGADTIAEGVGKALGLTVEVFQADWATYGRAAGPIRNKAMLQSGVHFVYAFHNDINNSKGTFDCVSQAARMGIPYEVVKSNEV